MYIHLFPHNQTAYAAAQQMLQERGKAAILHPTGTGKSFIGFKFCEENPDSSICWISPSAYIFHTQLENLKKATDGAIPENITFFTYQKLMFMDESEIAEIQPALIILDEFHRCGAEMWGAGVTRLLRQYLAVPVLGLSATSIRYLDNQRNMADELFDGNVASEITLGAAVVKGILQAPKYVLTAYSYQKDLEYYEKRLQSIKNKAIYDQASRYLNALRRSLEMADGLDVIFAKHMSPAGGKYIVFCTGIGHMKEMISLAPQWFSKVDPAPHIYKAYSNDPETSKAFADFKRDTSSHLRLLYCIDMLNEGVHVDDIDGVILLRPTISPIIYKQQIGRAMSAGSSKEITVFDVVMNINNLYSISSVQDEIDTAVGYYISHGDGSEIVRDHFEIIDELLDCRELFSRLEETLSASWDVMYLIAEQYYREHGDLNVPNDYKTDEGYPLGIWLLHQRNVRKGATRGILTEEQVQRLDAIQMPWDGVIGGRWERNYEALCRYYRENGHIDVPEPYITPDGIKLGQWVRKMRKARAASTRRDYLTPEREKLLDGMGMIWEKRDFAWERNYQAAAEYYKAHESLKMPQNYKTSDGVALGRWLQHVLQLYRDTFGTSLTEEQICQLAELGLQLPTKAELEANWHRGFLSAQDYYKRCGNLNVPQHFKTDSGFLLGRWISHERNLVKNETPNRPYSDAHREALNRIGMIWEPKPFNVWDKYFETASEYKKLYGDLSLKRSDTYKGVWLGNWLIRQRNDYRYGRLSAERIEKLESIGFSWKDKYERQWEEQYNKAKVFYQENGHLFIPARLSALSGWVAAQRAKRKEGKLSEEQIDALNDIGMNWTQQKR